MPMNHVTNSENEMQDFAKIFARRLKGGEIIELIGDVGAGKTTFVKGLAKGLKIKDTIQSPSFTVFARYKISQDRSLHHYDFYRLNDPGLIAYDLAESLDDKKAVTVIEWAHTVKHVLPDSRIIVHIKTTGETSRELDIKERKA